MDFQQTDANANASAIAILCSGASLNTTSTSCVCTVGGTAGVTAESQTMDGSAANLAAVWYELTIPADTTWAAGNWTIRLNCTTASAQCLWDAVFICRVNSSYVNQATIGSATGLAIALNTTGVKETVISGSAQTPSVGDKVIVVLLFDNTNSMTRTFGWTPDQIIVSPFTAAPVAVNIETTCCGSGRLFTIPTFILNSITSFGGEGNIPSLDASVVITVAISVELDGLGMASSILSASKLFFTELVGESNIEHTLNRSISSRIELDGVGLFETILNRNILSSSEIGGHGLIDNLTLLKSIPLNTYIEGVGLLESFVVLSKQLHVNFDIEGIIVADATVTGLTVIQDWYVILNQHYVVQIF